MGPAEADPPYVYYLDQSQLDVLEGGCYVMLEDPAAALPVLRRALAARPPTYLRSRTGLLVCMAISLLDAGEVVEATRVGGEAADLLAYTRSRQVRGRLGELRHRPHATATSAKREHSRNGWRRCSTLDAAAAPWQGFARCRIPAAPAAKSATIPPLIPLCEGGRNVAISGG
ncbi:MAG TPA: hypothetical protein VFA46_20370 [Actinomycetes bacterium]|jgi:hypothetical protein|nr:hypothetical protein [Actinomycetes bacterium]